MMNQSDLTSLLMSMLMRELKTMIMMIANLPKNLANQHLHLRKIQQVQIL